MFKNWCVFRSPLKIILKLLWPFLIVNLRITGLIWRGSAHFPQNNATIILPGTTSELPCRTPATHFWRQIRSFEALNVSYFSGFTICYGSWNCKSLFVNISWNLKSSPVKKVARFQCFSLKLTLTSGEKSFFAPAESWLINSNSKIYIITLLNK